MGDHLQVPLAAALGLRLFLPGLSGALGGLDIRGIVMATLLPQRFPVDRSEGLHLIRGEVHDVQADSRQQCRNQTVRILVAVVVVVIGQLLCGFDQAGVAGVGQSLGPAPVGSTPRVREATEPKLNISRAAKTQKTNKTQANTVFIASTGGTGAEVTVPIRTRREEAAGSAEPAIMNSPLRLQARRLQDLLSTPKVGLCGFQTISGPRGLPGVAVGAEPCDPITGCPSSWPWLIH